MSTTNPEEPADQIPGTDQPIATEAPTRPRRFAPRRSRGAGSAIANTEPSTDQDSRSVPAGALVAAGEPAQPLTPSARDQGEPDGGLTPVKRAQPSRPRRARDRRPAATAAAPLAAPSPSVGMVTEEVAPDSSLAASAERTADLAPVAGTPAQDAVSGDNGEAAASETSLAASSPPAVSPGSAIIAPAAGAARAARGRGRARPAAKPASAVGVVGETALGATRQTPSDEQAKPRPATSAKPSRSRRARPTRAAEAPVLVEETREEPVAAVSPVEPEPSEAVGTTELEPLVAETRSLASELGETPLSPTESAALSTDLANFLGLSSRQAETVGADLDGAELLARALRDMFPPVDPDTIPSGAATSVDTLPGFDLAAAAAALDAVLDALPEQPEAEESALESEEAQHRRGRRGRRGGRGRRRNGLIMVPPLDTAEAQPVADPSVSPDRPAEPEIAPQAPPIPISAAAPSSAFIPEQPPRAEPSWRDQRPRRNWGRVLPRDSQPAAMPPPKPSSTRFVPIPQALPPVAASAPPPLAMPRSTPFAMPDLRANEPLGPGETRSERLLDVQTRLMAAMLEQQARQIDVLTTSVSALYEAIQGIGTGGVGARSHLARTAVFVDAPNVVYAAENARVPLDYARMLKYLSRDRQLVHALSYSPIIDDVREGIRYETQRFVAPFLRAGYKLVTKPLKRFSDGSAKGNFDIELALDMLTMAERLDILVLVSGDSDFESVIEHIQSRGVRVEVVAFASNVSTELVNVADVFIDINQHIEHMRAL